LAGRPANRLPSRCHQQPESENLHESLQSASVVTSGDGVGGSALGAVGVLGPRRMDYAHTMARVAAVARYVGELIAHA